MIDYKRGFTLIELLIVMAILGILAAVSLGNFQSSRLKARDAKRKSDLSMVAKSLEAYVNDYNRYPDSSVDGKIVCQPPGGVCDWGDPFTDGGTKNTVYAAKLPEDGTGARRYIYNSSGNSFYLYAALENTNDPAFVDYGIDCGGENCNYKVTSPNVN